MAVNPSELLSRQTRPTRQILDESIRALSACGQDALSQAVCTGILDPTQAVDWVERAETMVDEFDNIAAVATENARATEAMRSGLREQIEGIDELVQSSARLLNMSTLLNEVARRFQIR